MPISFMFYLAGMSAVFFGDIYFSKVMTLEQLASWSGFKSLIFIGASVGVFGLDHVLVRRQHTLRAVYKAAAFTALSFSVIVGLIGSAVVTEVPALLTVLTISMLSVVSLHAGYFRSTYQLVPAQVLTNGWKVVFYPLGALFLWFEMSDLEFSVFTVAAIVLACFAVLPMRTVYSAIRSEKENTEEKNDSIASVFSLGSRFTGSMLVLTCTIYAEQLLLLQAGYVESAAMYFKHVAVFLPPAVVISGFGGFVAGPFVRKNTSYVNKYFSSILVGSLLFFLFMSVGVFYLSIMIFDRLYAGEIDLRLAFLLVCVGFFRSMYALVSSYFGVLADKRTLSLSVWFGVFCLGILIAGFNFFISIGIEEKISMAFSVATCWLLRDLFGIYMCWQIKKSYQESVA